MNNIILDKLFKYGCIKTGHFTLKSGLKSDLYIDMKSCISYPDIFEDIYNYTLQKFPHLFDGVEMISGVPFGGTPFAVYFSTNLKIPMIHLRDDKKTYGTEKHYEGNYNEEKILVLEDVVTTGKSVNEHISKMKELGMNVMDTFVLINRSSNKEIKSLFNLNDIYQYFLTKNKWTNMALNKKSNIIFSADMDSWEKIKNIISKIHHNIVGVKLHIESIKDFNKDIIDEIIEMKKVYNLFFIEDRKFSDIASTVLKEMDGYSEIWRWADFVTIHPLTGNGPIRGMGEKYPQIGIILISEMSSETLIDERYTLKSLELFRNNSNVVGVVSQNSLISKFEGFTFTPGINLKMKKDNLDQRYTEKSNNMFWIVGRGIYENIEDAGLYQEEGFKSFLEL